MSRYDRADIECKIYVGDLARDCTEKDLERAFSYYGSLRNVWVARNPPGFAFVEFEDSRDAEDAIHGLDGTSIAGSRVRVEKSTGKVRPKPWQRGGRDSRGPPRGGRRPYDPNDRCYECGDSGHYAYDCPRGSRRGGGGRDRRRSRSRSYDRRRRSRSGGRRSRSGSRDVSRSPRRSRSRSRSPKD